MLSRPIRLATIRTLGCLALVLVPCMACERTREEWVGDLGHQDGFVRVMAAAALAEDDPQATRPLIPTMIQLLGDDQPDVRNRAALFLARQGNAAIQPLIDSLSSAGLPNSFSRLTTDLLAQRGSAAIGPLLAQLESGRNSNLKSISTALGSIGEESLEGLVRLMQHDDPQVRRWSAHGIGAIGPAAAGATPTLLRALADNRAPVRMEAARAIGRLGSYGLEIHSRLLALFTDQDQDVREEAVRAVVGGVLSTGDSLDRDIRTALVGHLRALGSTAIVAVESWLYHVDSRVARRAASLLGRLGDPAIPALVAALCDRRCPNRSVLVPVIVQFGARAVPQLIQALSWRPAASRRAAAMGLAAIGPAAAEALPSLIEALNDPNEEVREQATRALSLIDGRGR